MADVSILNGYNIKDATARAEIANKIDNPSSKSSGQVLTYNGSAWEAQTPAAGMTATTYTATIPSASWTSSGGYYSKTVTVSGLKATYPVPPVIDCSLSGSDSTGDSAIIEAFKSLAIITTAANSITVKAIGAKPNVNIPITISVWE